MPRPFEPVRSSPHEEEARCESCREIRPLSELDENGWCPPCREELRQKMRRGQHLTALAVTVPFAVWILLGESFGVLPLYAWLLPLAAAYYLGYRIGREVVKGFVAWKRVRS